MQLFNSLSQQMEPFVVYDNEVKLYVCGITPYDTAHLGHAFTFGTFDILVRYLRSKGLSVVYVQNVTDIDDPLFAKADELGNITWDQLAHQETERFIGEMDSIRIALPDRLVRASEHLPAMIAMIEKLLESGNAYINDGWVYFAVSSDPQFARLAFARGLLSHDQLLNAMNQHGKKQSDPRKRDQLDFLLWQGAVAGEPAWPSPWGPGRPGWHIECSAMATKYLGPQLDIHGGGADLIFPHHSSEIAQAENVTGVHPYARFWMHAGIVKMAQLKMSKTEGNLIIVNKLLKGYSANAVRLLLAMHHYREDWEFTFPEMDTVQRLAAKLEQAVTDTSGQTESKPELSATDFPISWTEQAFLNALEYDLDTPRAVRVLDNLASACLSGLVPKDDMPLARLKIRSLAEILGLHLDKSLTEI